MASAISIPFREMLLRAFFSPDTFTAPTQLYVALTNDVGLINQSGDTLDEPTAGAYNRAVIPLDSTNWTLSGFGEVYNSNDVDYPPPTPGEDWGYIGGWALLDSPDSGITLAVGSLVVPTFYTSDQLFMSFAGGAITIGLTD